MILQTVLVDAPLDVGGERVLGPGAADDSGANAARLLVAVEDLGDAAVGDAQLARDDARPHARRRQLDDLQPDVVGQRAAVDEHAAQLVDAALT